MARGQNEISACAAMHAANAPKQNAARLQCADLPVLHAPFVRYIAHENNQPRQAAMKPGAVLSLGVAVVYCRRTRRGGWVVVLRVE